MSSPEDLFLLAFSLEISVDRAHTIARDFERGLTPGIDQNHDAMRAFLPILAHELNGHIGIARNLARDLVFDLTNYHSIIPARELARTIVGDFYRARNLADSLIDAFGLTEEINRDLTKLDPYCEFGPGDLAFMAVGLMDFDFPHDFEIYRARDFGCNLHQALTLIHENSYNLVKIIGIYCRRHEGEPLQIRPGAAAQQAHDRARWPPGKTLHTLTVIACQFLPAAHRARYTDEFYSELFELPRRHRLGHAIRVLRSAPSIRASLRATPAAERERQP